MKPKDLELGKMAFGGSSERHELAIQLGATLPQGFLRWLEIGAGDGRTLAWLIGRLGEGRSIDLVSLDPAYGPGEVFRPSCRSFEHHRHPFHAMTFEERFGCINLRQSAYYLHPITDSVEQIASLLGSSGRVALTCWSDGCLLYDLHVELAGRLGVQPNETTFETVGALFRKANLVELSSARVACPIDDDVVHASDPVAVALARLSARRLPIDEMSVRELAHATRSCLRRPSGNRVNGVAVYGRMD